MKRPIIIALVAATLATADERPTVFRLPDAIQHGLRYSPAAQNVAIDEDVARTRIGQAASLALPQLSLNANYTRLDEIPDINFGDGSIELGTLDNYEVAASVSQLLYSGGQVGAAWRAAQRTRQYAAIQRAAFQEKLAYDVTRHFLAVLLAHETLQVQEASVQMLRDFAQQATERRDNGATSEFDALTAQVRVANALPALIAAQNHLALSRSALATLIHFKGPFELEGSLTVGDLPWHREELDTLALQQRKERSAALLLVDLAQEAIANAKSAARPQLRLFANYIGDNASQTDFSDDWEWRWNAGISASWNIWDGDLTRQTVRQRELELEQQHNNRKEIESAILLEVQQAWLALQQAREALAASAETVALAQRALAIAQARYEAGLSTYLELADANLALRTAERTRLQAKHDHAVAEAMLYYATGTPSPHLPEPPPQQQTK